jgi:hypothetical protein
MSGHGSGPLRSPRVRSNESGRSLCPAVTYGGQGSGPDTFDRKGPGTGPDSNIGTGLICRALGSSAKQRAPANRRQQSFEFQPATKFQSTIGLTPDARRSVRAPITPGEPPASAGGCFNPPRFVSFIVPQRGRLVDRWRTAGNLPSCFCARRNLGSAGGAWRGRVENGVRRRSARCAPGPSPRSPVQCPRSGRDTNAGTGLLSRAPM